MNRRADDSRMVRNAPPDVVPDPVRGIGGKCVPALGLEGLARPHQAQGGKLRQIVELQSSAPTEVVLRKREGEPQVVGAHAVSKPLEASAGIGVAAGRLLSGSSHFAKELVALVATEERVRKASVGEDFANDSPALLHELTMPSAGSLRNIGGAVLPTRCRFVVTSGVAGESAHA